MNDQHAYLYEEINRLRKKKLIYQSLFAVGIILFLAGIVFALIPLSFFGLPFIALSAFLLVTLKKKMKERLGAPLVRSALSKVFDRVEYQPFGRLPDYVMELSAMRFPFDVDRIEGSDHVRATYRGMELQFSDIELIDRRSNGKNTQYVTVFQGIWLVCDFGKPISSGVLLQERNAFSFRFADKLNHGGNLIETENVEFNKKFLIVSQSQHDAFYVLTPHMMEYIMRMDRHGMGVSYLRFTQSGKVHIVINTGKDLFELDSKTDPAMLTDKFLDEIGYITGLIDSLHLSELDND